jgi:hypothetical protein
MELKIKIPRTTYDGVCQFIDTWMRTYRTPGAAVLRGGFRSAFGTFATKVFESGPLGDAALVAGIYNTALNALGRARVGKTEVVLDLRDLTQPEVDALVVVTENVALRPAQVRALKRVSATIKAFDALPEMMRIAVAMSD